MANFCIVSLTWGTEDQLRLLLRRYGFYIPATMKCNIPAEILLLLAKIGELFCVERFGNKKIQVSEFRGTCSTSYYPILAHLDKGDNAHGLFVPDILLGMNETSL